MLDEETQQLFDWGEEIRSGGRADVVVVDFRGSASIRADVIGVKEAFSFGALVPQIIAMTFNARRAPDIESALDLSGVPYTFVRRKVFTHTGLHAQKTSSVSQARDVVAAVVADDGIASRLTAASSNHEIARALSRITKRPVVYIDVPENIARQSMRQLGMPASLIEVLL